MNSLTAMGLTFLVLSWAMFLGANLTTGRPKVADALAFAAIPMCVLAVVGCGMGVVLEVTP